MIQLRSLGAVEEVTGSCHLVQVANFRILIDCGMFQGGRRKESRNANAFPFDPASIDAVILSHAHIDHSGRLPLLVKRGFNGKIYSHHATRDLCQIMLKDSASLNQRDCELENRRRERRGLALIEPLYSVAEAESTIQLFETLSYEENLEILPGVRVRLTDAGHILGSCIVELWLKEGSTHKKLVFTGDLGHTDAPILRDPTPIKSADLVLMESTYGDRLHRSWQETRKEFIALLESARTTKGNVLIPAFAVGRSQLLLYWMAKYFEEAGLKHWQVYLDSPLAIEASHIYAKHTELYDEVAAAMWTKNEQSPMLPNLHLVRTTEQSKGLNKLRSGAIIIAGSGMCTGGRITQHLLNNIWRRECHVILSGFQVAGTRGRALIDGAKQLRLFGETVRVAAQIHTIGGLSAHADQKGLLNWYSHFEDRPAVRLVHGEEDKQQVLADRLKETFGCKVDISRKGERVDL